MAEAIIGQGMGMASNSCAEPPNYEGIYGATEKSLASYANQKAQVINTSELDQELMKEAETFEQSNILNSWQNQLGELQKKQTSVLGQSGFAGAGLIEREFDDSRDTLQRDTKSQQEAQAMELKKAIRQSDASVESALANIQNQIRGAEAQFAAASGYEYKPGGAPQEESGCFGPERDTSY